MAPAKGEPVYNKKILGKYVKHFQDKEMDITWVLNKCTDIHGDCKFFIGGAFEMKGMREYHPEQKDNVEQWLVKLIAERQADNHIETFKFDHVRRQE